jgi:hypothetical protein
LLGMFSHFTPETTAILVSAHLAALEELLAKERDEALPLYKAVVSTEIARAILDAASMGERDPERLKQFAIAHAAYVSPD